MRDCVALYCAVLAQISDNKTALNMGLIRRRIEGNENEIAYTSRYMRTMTFAGCQVTATSMCTTSVDDRVEV